jgi:hypothetical protein
MLPYLGRVVQIRDELNMMIRKQSQRGPVKEQTPVHKVRMSSCSVEDDVAEEEAKELASPISPYALNSVKSVK